LYGQYVILEVYLNDAGDGDQGAHWYNDGKLEKKMNTFVDVHECMNHLINIGLVDKDRIALRGRSAGGLVAGNAMLSSIFIHRPKVVVAQVPFIDPIYDLIDRSIPWTAFEWYYKVIVGRNGAIHRMKLSWKPCKSIRLTI
jgi:oligopeptidase B